MAFDRGDTYRTKEPRHIRTVFLQKQGFLDLANFSSSDYLFE